ncbi:hypothetical protein Tco_0255892 [Tanacetum coccineum]
MAGSPNTWLKFDNREYSKESKKTYRDAYKVLMKKEIKGPEALNFVDYGNIQNGRALQDLDEFCRVSFRHEDRSFSSQTWNMLFRIQEHVIREYVLEFLSIVSFRDHVVDLDVNDILVFQLGGVTKKMAMRQFSLALRLYSAKEMNNNLFAFYHAACVRNKPNNYDPNPYFRDISSKNHFDSSNPFSYTTIKNLIHRLVHRLLTLFMPGIYSAKEKKKSKIMGAYLIGRLARHFGLMSTTALKLVTRGQETTLYDVVKLGELGIFRFNGLGHAEIDTGS